MECCKVATGKQLTDVSEDYWKQQEERHFLDFLTLKKPLLSFETSVLFTDPSVVTYQRISVWQKELQCLASRHPTYSRNLQFPGVYLSSPYVLHASPISFFLISSHQEYRRGLQFCSLFPFAQWLTIIIETVQRRIHLCSSVLSQMDLHFNSVTEPRSGERADRRHMKKPHDPVLCLNKLDKKVKFSRYRPKSALENTVG